ncbi:actin-related protein 2/3 complex subunit 1A-like [Lingula anatina]|uniref:Actin-related protein 2/3 complex subunit n=1 Tax=Lingula anatina TaxID=7574 RepID=A0A1S3ILE7_LINAN|nr:actin-related protein 2/3 complex subunit 1A-like [Lingula anatina]|eukprot:XP_013399042.1 actin-related protein 2/3 complex subunit 1A-like [Lingula anatina]
MATPYSFGIVPIGCHAFNKARNEVAISPNNAEVHIYKQVSGRWEKMHVLEGHGQRVTSLDWAPESNRIVSCGVDRNAYVWTFTDGKWKPTLVILRINRAATCVRWSPQENKFAVGSGARVISVCYFEKENDWWVSKHIKKPIRSTVTSLDWHPNNILLAAGSTDFKARVFSGWIKECEAKPQETPWGKKMPLGNLMVEFSNAPGGGGGWVHSVGFSPSGDKLAWVGHDSSVSVVSVHNKDVVTNVKTTFLPFLSLIWATENSIVVAGHDCCPVLYSTDDQGKLAFVSKLDIPQEKEGGTLSAMKRFQTLDKKATTDDASSDLKTKHQNSITQLSVYSGSREQVTKFASSGVDGQIVVWDFKSLESAIAGLRIA